MKSEMCASEQQLPQRRQRSSKRVVIDLLDELEQPPPKGCRHPRSCPRSR